MEKIDIIFLIPIGLAVIAAVSLVLLVRDHNKLMKEYNKEPFDDDAPGRYSEIFDSERPYVEM